MTKLSIQKTGAYNNMARDCTYLQSTYNTKSYFNIVFNNYFFLDLSNRKTKSQKNLENRPSLNNFLQLQKHFTSMCCALITNAYFGNQLFQRTLLI